MKEYIMIVNTILLVSPFSLYTNTKDLEFNYEHRWMKTNLIINID